ncbi:sulfite reductase flavoprotein subunit alpha [Acinetobacter sp. NIPH 2699]|uniref:sulfite reductase subunit alpha n=1 Tax=Acinetobacter sp. NIPH 2699 TaxID=2923433 RepID=UPI001F4BA958|nr:sulfite reductase flavoprotein subunit alpha [Acinetobacter sp. NIPH 2699]MCH7336984.1 sulfite reductase flavoprotein subunit alpha [Acinetobacter sp. NIPH 2699]
MTQALFLVMCALLFLLLLHLFIIIYLFWRQLSSRIDTDVTAQQYLVVYASQTGQAETWAKHTAEQLKIIHEEKVELLDIQQLNQQHLQQPSTILWVVSTYGEGDAPDTAQDFVHKILAQSLDLSHLSFAVLALGDRRYSNFCQFGKRLEHWLLQRDAHVLFPTVLVDQLNSDDLEQWLCGLEQLTSTKFKTIQTEKARVALKFAHRQCLNEGGTGEAIYKVQLIADQNLQWSSGDILEIQCENDSAEIQHFLKSQQQQECSDDFVAKLRKLNLRKCPSREDRPFAEWIEQFELLPQREYSIASLAEQGLIELVVRQQRSEAGFGLGSGWLTIGLEQDQLVQASIHNNPSFHLRQDDKPLILIGNGTGIAGLVAHLRQREYWGHQKNWLIFGERQQQFDHLYHAEIEYWQQQGFLAQVDYAFSRDQSEKIYVQDRLRQQSSHLQEWIAQGAAIYVCGSLKGMASGVDQVLQEILGTEQLQQLKREQRYQRDVY